MDKLTAKEVFELFFFLKQGIPNMCSVSVTMSSTFVPYKCVFIIL